MCILGAAIRFIQLFKFLVGQKISFKFLVGQKVTVFKERKIKFCPSYMPKAISIDHTTIGLINAFAATTFVSKASDRVRLRLGFPTTPVYPPSSPLLPSQILKQFGADRIHLS